MSSGAVNVPEVAKALSESDGIRPGSGEFGGRSGSFENGWTAAKVGMAAFLCSEAVFFATLLVAYITYIGATTEGPTPGKSLNLEIAIINSFFLIASSFTVMLAVKAFGRQSRERSRQLTDDSGNVRSVTPDSTVHRPAGYRAFTLWMFATIALGLGFLGGTAYEWKGLIWDEGLTISRSLFGTTYFTLVGFHATHVTVGLSLMGLLVWRARRGEMAVTSEAPELLSWYWHLVDAVWIAIVLIVYVLGL